MGLFDFLFNIKKYETIDYCYVNYHNKLKGIQKFHQDHPEIPIYGFFRKDIQQILEIYPDLKIHHIKTTLPYSSTKSGVFIDHYPTFNKEKEVIESMNLTKVYFFTSLDSAIFKLIKTENITRILKSLNVKEEEVLSHSYISNAIKNIQKKNQSKIKTEWLADSTEEWFKKNIL